MLDLDQTVLDTSRYNARIILQHNSHTREHFAEWCRQSTAPTIPGAKELIEHATRQGVAVIYVSARREALRDCTTRNLQALGLPLPSRDHLLLNDGTPSTSKTQRRADVAAQYRILLLVGDNLNDFVSDSRTDPDTRRALVNEHAARWGREWIILPNPMYGNWEASLYEYDYSLPRDERLDRLLQQLEQ
jgi:acid phosphatase